MAESLAVLVCVQLEEAILKQFPKGCAPGRTPTNSSSFCSRIVTTYLFHVSHSGGAGAHLIFTFISVPVCWWVLFCFVWGLNFISFHSVAEELFQFLLKLTHPTGNRESPFLSFPRPLILVLSPDGCFQSLFLTSQPPLGAAPAGDSCDPHGMAVWIMCISTSLAFSQALVSNFCPSPI